MTRLMAACIVCTVIAWPCHGICASSIIAELGDYFQVIVPAYAFGMAVNEKDYQGVKEFAYSFLAMEASVQGLKLIIPETRPDGSNDKSFPSGHTAAAFSGATFIHKRYGIKRAIIPYLMATFTGYSRIAANKHYFHDVVAGAAISSLFTWIFVGKYDGVQVAASPESVSLKFNLTF